VDVNELNKADCCPSPDSVVATLRKWGKNVGYFELKLSIIKNLLTVAKIKVFCSLITKRHVSLSVLG
jgi:hypothetical protein